MEETLLRYVALYNHQLPQSALKSSTPMQAMKDWYQTHPHLFHKRPYDRTGCDSCRIPDDCIDSKRYPLFMARAVLKELIESLQSTQGVKPC